MAPLAVNRKNIHSLRYIHSIVPRLLLCEDASGKMPIDYLTVRDEYLDDDTYDDPFQDFASPSSEILR